MSKVLFVGCGLSTGMMFRGITKHLIPNKSNHPFFKFHFWEASDRIGGRLLSHNTDFANIGAQYFTFDNMDAFATHSSSSTAAASTSADHISQEFPSNLMNDLISNGVLTRMPTYRIDEKHSSQIPIIANVRSDHYSKIHFVAPRGTSSVVDYLLNNNNGASNSNSSSSSSSSSSSKGDKSDSQYEVKEIECNKTLTALSFNKDRNCWVASSSYSFEGDNASEDECFDMVFLSIPFPNLVKIQGNWLDYVAKYNHKDSSSSSSSSSSNNNNNPESLLSLFKDVQYSSRFAAVFSYSFPLKNGSDVRGENAIELFKRLLYNSKYTPSDPIIRYVAVFGIQDVIKTESIEMSSASSSSLPKNISFSILVHTSPQFYKERELVDDNSISSEIYSRLLDILSVDLSESPSSVSAILDKPTQSYFKRWIISQKLDSTIPPVGKSIFVPITEVDESATDNEPLKHIVSHADLTKSNLARPILGISGDSFTHSNFDGCLQSAISLLQKLNSYQ